MAFSDFPTLTSPCLDSAHSSLKACLNVMDSEKPFPISLSKLKSLCFAVFRYTLH